MRKIKVGLDFDGVVAYNPVRIVRAPIKWFKREVLGIRKLTFFVPKNNLQRVLWTLIHESSIFPARGLDLLKQMAGDSKYEFHLITARFGFLKDNLFYWLRKNQLSDLFETVNINENQEQPHEYKERKLNELDLDYFVEDNLDIVMHLQKNTDVKVYWIYNLFDKNKNYADKFPYLEKALEEISK